MQQLINVQTVIKSAALASALGAIAIPRTLSYARREPVRKMMEGAEKRGEGYEGWRWIWEVLKMSTVRRQGASGAAGLRRVGLGEKIKAQVLRWRDWKARGRGRQRRVLLAEYLTSRKKAGKERWSGGGGGVLRRGLHESAAKGENIMFELWNTLEACLCFGARCARQAFANLTLFPLQQTRSDGWSEGELKCGPFVSQSLAISY